MSEIKGKVPALRFPEFEGDWVEISFGEVYSFHSTNSYSRDNLNYDNGKVKNIHYGDIHTKFKALLNVKNENLPFINESLNADKLPLDCFCKEKDLVIADASEDYNDIGKSIEMINSNNEKIVAGLHTILARPDIGIDLALGFGSYLMQTSNVKLQIMVVAQGIKVIGLSSKQLATIALVLPFLSEQQKIASFLSAIDERIQLLKQKKSQLEAYKKGVMQQIFSQQIRFKDENGEDYPDWEEKRLGDKLDFCRNGLNQDQNSNFDIGFKVTRIETISDGKINLSKVGYINSIEGLENYKLRVGDILYSNINSVAHIGKTAYVEWDYDLYHGMNLLCLRPNDKSNSKMLYYYLNTESTRNYFRKICNKAVNQASINQADLQKTVVILPKSQSEQQKIADFLTAIDNKISLCDQQITQNEQYKKGLLQQMFV